MNIWLEGYQPPLLKLRPAAKPPVREADRWRGSRGTGRFPQLQYRPIAVLAFPPIRSDRKVDLG
jgi:hypothetical protein